MSLPTEFISQVRVAGTDSLVLAAAAVAIVDIKSPGESLKICAPVLSTGA